MAVYIMAKQFGPTRTMWRLTATICFQRKVYNKDVAELKKMEVRDKKARRDIPGLDGIYWGPLIYEQLETNRNKTSLQRLGVDMEHYI